MKHTTWNSAGQYLEAIAAYTEALKSVATNDGIEASEAPGALPGDGPELAALYSNRAAAHEQRGSFAAALQDAQAALNLAPQWPKAHLRCGAGFKS